MANFRFPILIWEDFAGFFTARAVGDESNYFPIAGFAPTREEAVSQIKEYLQWQYERHFWLEPPSFQDLNLMEFRVDVRTEYQVESQAEIAKTLPRRLREKLARKRSYIAEETIPLRVNCVHWREESGSFFCALPLLDIEFHFYDGTGLKQLVQTYVQEKLKGLTPQEIAKFLPPKNVWLESLSVSIKRKEREAEFVKETPTLNQIAEPLGAKSERLQTMRAFERDTEVTDLIERLTKERANVLLLSESGIGKTTVLTEAVRKIERELNAAGEKNDDDLYDEFDYEKLPKHRFWQTNAARLISGMKYLGQWEQRCETVVQELSDIEGVLCVENLLDLVKSGGSEPNTGLAAFFMPYLQTGELRMVAEATPAELDACRRLLPGLPDLFRIIELPAFTPEKALSVLNILAQTQTRNTKIGIETGVTNLIYRLFSRFLPYQTFPGRAVNFLHELFEKAVAEKIKEITKEQTIQQFIKLTGLPELFLRDEIRLDVEEVVKEFEAQVIGQSKACRLVSRLVTTFKAGLNDPQRPLGVLLFAGPTGVGKTELAKAISRFFFGHGDEAEKRLVRLDMSEYSLGDAASRLLTNADGEPSELLQKVRQQPFCVVLFDEIEKADAQVFDVLLGMFDEGRLTDRFGRVTNFRSAVIVLTSNIGAEKFASAGIGFGENLPPSSERAVQAFFRPEFFNRLDEVVQFVALTPASLHEITRKELKAVARREGLNAAKIELIWTENLVAHLANIGYDARYGARPLQRTIENLVTAPLAKFLLREDCRQTKLTVDVNEKGEIIFNKSKVKG